MTTAITRLLSDPSVKNQEAVIADLKKEGMDSDIVIKRVEALKQDQQKDGDGYER